MTDGLTSMLMPEANMLVVKGARDRPHHQTAVSGGIVPTSMRITHRMVFMHDVMTVHHIAALEVTEANKHFGLANRAQRRHIPPGIIDGAIILNIGQDRVPVHRQRTMLLEMDVDRVRPATPAIPEHPDFFSLLRRVSGNHILIEECAINLPCPRCCVRSGSSALWPSPPPPLVVRGSQRDLRTYYELIAWSMASELLGYVSTMHSRIRLASTSISKGFVITCMPGSK